MSWSTVMFAVPPHDLDPLEVDKVARITTALDARLEIFRCAFREELTGSDSFAPEDLEERIRLLVSSEKSSLEHLAAQFRGNGLKVTKSVRWDYPVYEGIVRQVFRHKPRLLIAQSSRRGPISRHLLTHTDWKLIETCPCPLLLLKNHRPYEKPLLIAAVDPGHAHDKPAALDEQILEAAGFWAEALSGRTVVFHAGIPWDEAMRADPQLRDLPEYRDEDAHRTYVEQIEARVLELAGRSGIAREQVHVDEGAAAESLARYADQQKADVVVMGAVSRSRLRRAFIGHTAERTLDALECDVLVVKPPGFRSSVTRQSTHHVASKSEPRIRAMW